MLHLHGTERLGMTMGQHKYNPTAIAAARGELPPKPPKKSKRQRDAEIRMAVLAALEKHVPGTAVFLDALTLPGYGGQKYV